MVADDVAAADGREADRLRVALTGHAFPREDAALLQVAAQRARQRRPPIAKHGLRFELLTGFLYPGHTRARMHTLPERTGAALIAALEAALAAAVPGARRALTFNMGGSFTTSVVMIWGRED